MSDDGRPKSNLRSGAGRKLIRGVGRGTWRATKRLISPSVSLRAGIMALGAGAIALGITTDAGVLAAVAGAIAGVIGGDVLARGRLRTVPMITVLALLLGVAWGLARATVQSQVIPEMLGPVAALSMGTMLEAGAAAFTLTAILRVTTERVASLAALELVVAAGAVASLFAAHRDGVVARPLWLSDWAWQHGWDPQMVLMGIGGVLVTALGLLMLLESRRRFSWWAIAPLPALVIAAMMFIDADDLPKPNASNDLGLTDDEIGEPPQHSDTPGQKHPGPGSGQGQGQGEQSGPLEELRQGGQSDGGQDPNTTQNESGGGGQGGDRQSEGGGGQQGDQQGQGQGQGQQGQGQQGQGQQGQGQQGQGQQGQGQQGQGQSDGPQNRQPDLNRDQGTGNSPAPMAVVILRDDYTPPMGAFYFRQQTWSEYNGSRLVEPRRGDVDHDTIRRFPARPVDAREPPPTDFTTPVNASVALVVRHVNPFALESVKRMWPTRNPKPDRFWRAYDFESAAPTWEPRDLLGRKAGHPDWTEEQWEFYTRPPNDPRFAELAKEIVAELPADALDDPFRRALAVKLWLDDQMTYSTAERHADAADPTADCVFGNKIGYCVHFAHAAVYLWRTLGIPSRASAGYHVEEDKVRGSTILIQGGDAHAWPEFYLQDVGWVILDVAPRRNLDTPPPAADTDMSELMGEWAREEPTEEAELDETGAPKKRDQLPVKEAVGISFMLLLLLAWTLKVWRRMAPRFATARQLPRAAFRSSLDRLAEVGVVREHGETREAFARRVRPRFPSLATMTALNAAAHLRDPARDRSAEPEHDRATWSGVTDTLRAEIKATTPRWRRALGFVDPIAFLRTR